MKGWRFSLNVHKYLKNGKYCNIMSVKILIAYKRIEALENKELSDTLCFYENCIETLF